MINRSSQRPLSRAAAGAARKQEEVTDSALSDAVYETLVKRILRGEAAEGTVLSELKLAKELGVSRTPVHDALRQLGKDGLVVQERNRRSCVARFTPDDLFEIFELRKILEGPAAELAAGRMDARQLAPLRAMANGLRADLKAKNWIQRWAEFDEAFHRTIAEACGNARLCADIGRYRLLHRVFNKTATDRKSLRQALGEHEKILDALEARDGGRARERMITHIAVWQEYFVHALRRAPIKGAGAPRSRSKRKAAGLASLLAVFLAFVAAAHGAAPKTQIELFLSKHCVACHGPEKQKGKLRLDNLDPNVSGGRHAEIWNHVRERLADGDMPPEDKPQPPRAQVEAVVKWLGDELTKSGKMLAGHPRDFKPSAGNKVAHALLFGPLANTLALAATPPRLWRLSPQLYGAFMHEFTKNKAPATQAFSQPPGEGIKDYAAATFVDEPVTTMLLRNAEAFVESQCAFKIEDGKRKGGNGTVKEFIEVLDEAQPADAKKIESAIKRQFQVVLRREASAEELKRFSGFMEKNIREAGRDAGVKYALAAVFLLPEAIFRVEMGDGPADAAGRRRLAPRDIALAVSYALSDRRPDAALMAAAEKGQLATREQVAEQVARIWSEPKIAKPRLLRFFQEYFGYTAADEVFKDNKDFKEHRAGALVRDTDALVLLVLAEDKDVLHNLLLTDKIFVNWRIDPNSKKEPRQQTEKNRKVHLSYNLPEDWQWTPDQPITAPEGQRLGVLTQPSWLVAQSSNFDNHAIRRGKWIREHLLGGNVPEIPITVEAQLIDDPTKTLRERMVKTREEYCWQCHAKMNPLGLAFENFDHFGRKRDLENGKPVDASGAIEKSGDPKLDAPVQDSLDLVRRLAASEHVRQVFVRHVFRYFLGRNETANDAGVLQAADRAYADAGGSFKALITSLLTSDAFLYRKGQGKQTSANTSKESATLADASTK